MLQRLLLLLPAVLLQIHIFGQTETDKDFTKFLKQFPELSIDDPYIVVDNSVINSKQVIPPKDVLKYFSMQLNFQEYCYPIGVYTYDKFCLLRVQHIIIAKPKIIHEYLVSVTKDGKYISKILSGGYSADAASTYRISSEIGHDKIVTVYSVTEHKDFNEEKEKGKKETYIYHITDKGEILKVEE